MATTLDMVPLYVFAGRKEQRERGRRREGADELREHDGGEDKLCSGLVLPIAKPMITYA